ncbi:MAG: HAMP domain-containing histidine kinase [Alphaproteobacteria bacterium]|nr:HAMP domain-containing histidine kinase [Alphaproteobacteria bacterium]
MSSLRRRAILGGLIWAMASFVVCVFLLIKFFDNVATERFESLLAERHLQVVTALGNSANDPAAIENLLTDPGYSRPYSGRYWQIEGPDGLMLTSRSLFDTTLPRMTHVSTRPHFWQAEAASGPIRGMREAITFEDGSRYVVSVALSLNDLISERQSMQANIFLAFAIIGVFSIASAVTQVSVILRQLAKVRQDVAHRWDEGETLNADDYPEEVAPFVSDINALLTRNREIVARGRRQAADLAHALKTPSAALRNELDDLSRRTGQTERAREALDRIDAQIVRSLARLRASSSSAMGNLRTDLSASVDRMARLFTSMAAQRDRVLSVDKAIDCAKADNCVVVVDQHDLEEMMVNMLENALKWSQGCIRLSTRLSDDSVEIIIEDDGPGICPDRRQQALQAGARLDTAVPGTGLGLAISSDIAHAYGGSLDLLESEDLGGLMVVIRLPKPNAHVTGLPSAKSDAPAPA